jgi:hypothetical protein
MENNPLYAWIIPSDSAKPAKIAFEDGTVNEYVFDHKRALLENRLNLLQNNGKNVDGGVCRKLKRQIRKMNGQKN